MEPLVRVKTICNSNTKLVSVVCLMVIFLVILLVLLVKESIGDDSFLTSKVWAKQYNTVVSGNTAENFKKREALKQGIEDSAHAHDSKFKNAIPVEIVPYHKSGARKRRRNAIN